MNDERLSIRAVAAWYLPLLACTLAPAAIVAWAGAGHRATVGMLGPVAAVVSAGLALMLFFICVAANAGPGERIACLGVAITMGFVLGADARFAQPGGIRANPALRQAALAGATMGIILIVQVLCVSRWKVWAGVLACLALLAGGTCLSVILRGNGIG